VALGQRSERPKGRILAPPSPFLRIDWRIRLKVRNLLEIVATKFTGLRIIGSKVGIKLGHIICGIQ
jgi:hypothetical protein